MNKIVIILSLGVCCLDASTTQNVHITHEWGYPNLEESEEFQNWGGDCDNGRQQSPIDINFNKVLKGIYPKLIFNGYNSIAGCNIVNNGHSIQLSSFPQEMEISGGPLLASYIVEQIHFHWWSEHTLNNTRYPFEMHVVHRNKKYGNMTQAMKFKNGITVLGILYHYSNVGNPSIENVGKALNDSGLFNLINDPRKMNRLVSMKELIPQKIDSYITYEGSLTTPLCSEIVQWIIPLTTFPVRMNEILPFRKIENDDGKVITNNFREIQKTRNRPLIEISENIVSSSTKNDGLVSSPLTFFVLVCFVIPCL
ncbi:hypothetical protein ACFFRR_005792 [Megaselia abdita]